jgi:hypothetical protein
MVFWLVLEPWEISYRVIIISWRILVSLRGFFEDYIFAWWNIWVFIILLFAFKMLFNVNGRGATVCDASLVPPQVEKRLRVNSHHIFIVFWIHISKVVVLTSPWNLNLQICWNIWILGWFFFVHRLGILDLHDGNLMVRAVLKLVFLVPLGMEFLTLLNIRNFCHAELFFLVSLSLLLHHALHPCTCTQEP